MKTSISLADEDMKYLDSQVSKGRYSSRSAAVTAGIKTLRERDMEEAYAHDFARWSTSGEAAVWDAAVSDGLGGHDEAEWWQ
jgi:putative addiction module CopG family antidote